MAFSAPKPWVNPFRKKSVFSLLQLLIVIEFERRFFVLEYDKRHFPAYIALKRKVGKMAIF